MKINQDKIEVAIKALAEISSTFPNGFPNEMKGDISSFGAGIIQAGLLPSVLFFSEGGKESESKASGRGDEATKGRRALLMRTLFKVLELKAAEQNKYSDKRPLLDYVRQNLKKHETLDDITEAALALKVAMRAFPFAAKENKKSDSSTAKKETK
ncbi:MAG: hypothetical protein KDC86_16980 [Saprospiraceae bacterium]|nr:hypothetical protein [Saprospiraceae bacterium]